MHYLFSKLINKKLAIRDQTLGMLTDVLFDDNSWQTRYAVCDSEATQKQWLLNADAFHPPRRDSEFISLKVKDAHIIEAEKVPPVSAQKKEEQKKYREWPLNHLNLEALSDNEARELADLMTSHRGLKNSKAMVLDEHLRSGRELLGYRLSTLDEEFGHLDDLLIDEKMKIRYLVVDTRNWLPAGKKVLLPIAWAEKIVWSDNVIHVTQTREKLENCKEFDNPEMLTEHYERALFKHYGGDL